MTAVLPRPLALAEDDWTARAAAHRERVDRWVAPHLERRRGYDGYGAANAPVRMAAQRRPEPLVTYR